MTHPHNHHAAAALWSLQAALPELEKAAQRARQAADEAGDLGTLRSQVYGTIGRTSGHGDPIGTAMERGRSLIDPYSDLAVEVDNDIRLLARCVLDQPAAGLEDLLAAVPTLGPQLAAMVTAGVEGMDRRVRRRLGMPDDLRHIPGHRCPGCDTAGALAFRSSAPGDWHNWPVVCTHRCACTGPGCGCGMTIEAVGVAHIWTAAEMTEVLARVEGVAA